MQKAHLWMVIILMNHTSNIFNNKGRFLTPNCYLMKYFYKRRFKIRKIQSPKILINIKKARFNFKPSFSENFKQLPR